MRHKTMPKPRNSASAFAQKTESLLRRRQYRYTTTNEKSSWRCCHTLVTCGYLVVELGWASGEARTGIDHGARGVRGGDGLKARAREVPDARNDRPRRNHLHVRVVGPDLR